MDPRQQSVASSLVAMTALVTALCCVACGTPAGKGHSERNANESRFGVLDEYLNNGGELPVWLRDVPGMPEHLQTKASIWGQNHIWAESIPGNTCLHAAGRLSTCTVCCADRHGCEGSWTCSYDW